MINYAVWILVIVLYWPVFSHLYHIRWDTVDYTHAYFILPLSLWLVWRKRAEIRRVASEPVTHQVNFISGIIHLAGILMFLFRPCLLSLYCLG